MTYRFRDSLVYKINKVTNSIRFQFNRRIRTFDITGEQFAIMKIVDDSRQLTQIQIAKVISKDKTTVARATSLLEKKGCIRKVRNKDDKRAYFIELNEKGRQILCKTLPIAEKYEDMARNRLSGNEIKTFFNVLNIMRDLSEKMFQEKEEH